MSMMKMPALIEHIKTFDHFMAGLFSIINKVTLMVLNC